MKRMTLTLHFLLLTPFIFAGFLAGCAHDAKEVGDPSVKVSAPLAAHDATPLWSSVPKTISPEWGAFFSEKGQSRETPMPAPGDLEAWKSNAVAEVTGLRPILVDSHRDGGSGFGQRFAMGRQG